jgi:hypothetical protein
MKDELVGVLKVSWPVDPLDQIGSLVRLAYKTKHV